MGFIINPFTGERIDNNCGTGAGGFKPGNKCGKKGAGKGKGTGKREVPKGKGKKLDKQDKMIRSVADSILQDDRLVEDYWEEGGIPKSAVEDAISESYHEDIEAHIMDTLGFHDMEDMTDSEMAQFMDSFDEIASAVVRRVVKESSKR